MGKANKRTFKGCCYACLWLIALLISTSSFSQLDKKIEKAIAVQKAIYDECVCYQSKITVDKPKESKKYIRLFYPCLKRYEKASSRTVRLMNKKYKSKT